MGQGEEAERWGSKTRQLYEQQDEPGRRDREIRQLERWGRERRQWVAGRETIQRQGSEIGDCQT